MYLTGPLHSSRCALRHQILLIALFLLQSAYACAARDVAEADEIWLLVDTTALTLKVMQGESTLQQYENIAIGSNGPTLAKLVRDETTPLGEFRISGFNPLSRFHLFMAFDYPTMEHARRALADGRLTPQEYVAVNNAWLAEEPPPQNTPLGGYLGIHGLGVGDEEIHGRFNWTNGCIAVTNEQIDELAQWVVVGTRVSVR